jgi:hypothetical protein
LAQGVVGFILEVIGKMFSETKAQVHSSFMIYIVIKNKTHPTICKQKIDPGDLHFPPDAWFEYDPDVSFLLGDQYATILQSGGFECDTKDGTAGPVKILDLAMFTNPPLPYSIWRSSKPVEVTNPSAPPSMFGKHLIGCFDAGFWSRVAKCMPGQPLPPSCGMTHPCYFLSLIFCCPLRLQY